MLLVYGDFTRSLHVTGAMAKEQESLHLLNRPDTVVFRYSRIVFGNKSLLHGSGNVVSIA